MSIHGELILNILVIEGSTDTSLVAVKTVKGSFERYTREKGSHSRDLFVNIESVLAEAGIAIQDIDCIGVGIGPGSFTGIRIAVSSARMLAQVTGKALVGVSSPRLYAESVESAEGDIILSAFDAKKGRVFAEVYRRNKDGLEVLLIAGDYFPEEIIPVLKGVGNIITVGDGSEKYRDNFNAENLRVIESFVPDGAHVCDYIEKEYLKNPEKYADFRNVLPCYARKSDAEVLREKTGV
jgi:tRNA threonylcarbamoyladenosine biosynthesis protein TsaB